MTGRRIWQLAHLLPVVLFYAVYSLFGLLPAICVSGAVSACAIIRRLAKKQRVSNMQVLGLMGLLLSFVAVIFGGNENLYYVPALVSNCCMAVFALVLMLRKQSILHYVVKDFDFGALRNIPESEFLRLNALWLAFFVLKIVSKAVGILFLEFKTLYWVVFLLGDPMTIALAAYSVWFVNQKLTQKKEVGT